MREVEVNSSTKTYTVYIGKGLCARSGEAIRAIAPGAEKAAIITDDNVDRLYADKVIACCAPEVTISSSLSFTRPYFLFKYSNVFS